MLLTERIEKAKSKALEFKLVPIGGLLDDTYEYILFASPLITCETNEEDYKESYLAYLLHNIKNLFEYSPYSLDKYYEYFIVRKYRKR